MKINLMSDLHLEACAMHPLDGGETLLLAGDILVAAMFGDTTLKGKEIFELFSLFFEECSAKYQNVYYIAGNHEHYYGSIDFTPDILTVFTCQFDNIHYLNNEVIELTDKTMLFGGTMWTNLNERGPIAMEAAMQLRDFHRIKKNGEIFTPEDSVQEHEATLNCLHIALQEYPDKDFLVMTHHTPSFSSIHPRWQNDPVNHAFSSDLDSLIYSNKRIKNWVHGHTHDSFNYKLGGTHVMCNPRGYTYSLKTTPENRMFDIHFNFEVE